MRTDCRHYESRTYASGETMRMCRLDLAPDAPWRCPADCASFEPRAAGAGWTIGTLQEQPTPPEPDLEGAAELLDQAEGIVNAIGPQVLADAERLRAIEDDPPFWRRLFRRRR